MIPPHSAPERLIHSSADKIDINDSIRDGNVLYMPRCTRLGKDDVLKLLHWKVWHQQSMQRLQFLGSWTLLFHASDTGVTTELQFDNPIRVEWFDKTLSESYLGLKVQSIDHSIFIQQGGHSRTWTWHYGYSC